MGNGFTGSTYTVRKKVFKIFGGAFHVYGPNGEVILYSKQKAFKLKEDIRMYTGEDMQTEVLCIQACSILDFSSAYDVVDATTGEKVGALKRKGLKSILKDEWIIMDAQGNDIGLIQEDSTVLALIRRFLTNLIPQGFSVTVNGQPIGKYTQNFNPFVKKITADFSGDPENVLDRRLGIAGAVLLCAIEGRQ